MKKMIFVFYIPFLFLTIGDRAISAELRFKKFGLEAGLSQSRVFSIVQDSKGFIWVGTEDGLNRYDGYQFKVFSFDPNDSTSIRNNLITSLAADDSGNVWAGTSYGGLNKYIARTGRFINYRNDPNNMNSIACDQINFIHRDAKHNLWLVTDPVGFDYFDVTTGIATHHRHDPDNPNSLNSDNNIKFIFQDSRGNVWIGSNSGLDRYFPGTKTYKHYLHSVNNPDGLNTNQITCIFEDRQGTLWIGTAGGGLNRFDPQTETFSHLLLDESDLSSVSNSITCVLEDSNGLLWVGTAGGGLFQIEKHSGTRNRYVNSLTDNSSISADFITAIFEDRTGEIWIGTDLDGLNKVDRSATKFRTVSVKPGEKNSLSVNPIRSFWEDKNGVLWLGTAGGGLDRYDRRKNMFTNYHHQPGNQNSLSNDEVRAIYQDKAGIFWLGTNRGVNRFDPQQQSFSHLYINPKNPDGPVNIINYKIMELADKPGVLWIASNDGLCKYDIKAQKLTKYKQETSNTDTEQINLIRTIYQYKKDPNILWVGTIYGFFRFDLSEETFKNYMNQPDNPNSLSANHVMGFYEDQQGNLYIATYGGGINYFNPETEEFKFLTTKNSGLPSNSVYGFLADNNGNLWLSTNRGISKFNPQAQIFKNYTVEDGLQSDEFNGGAYYQSYTGEMFFGGIGGYNSFYPESIGDNTHKPQIELVDFKLFNRSIDIVDQGLLPQHISETKRIVLNHWQNDIEIAYVALHYYRSSNNTYAYKLDNYDKDWRFVGTDRSAVYTNLDPGDYTFRVKAANSDGIWNENGPVLKILILPPWYATTWAYIGYGLIFVLGIFSVDRFQRLRLSQREQNRVRMREAELRAKAAEEENARKSRELEEARRLQLSLLPESLPHLPNLEIAVYMKTATEVGGDYYDYNISADGTLNIALGDATGHGMRAGTVVTLMKGLFSADSGRMAIDDFFRQSSATIKDLRFGRMMMSFTLVKIKDNKILFSSAGMPPAYIYRSSTLKVEELSQDGLPLGAMKASEYKVKQEHLNEGDTILLMSDGLPELKNPDGELFDYSRVEGVFRDVAGKPSQEIVDRLVDAGEIWRKNRAQDDDVTLMVIRAC